jgi:hypothetical protein
MLLPTGWLPKGAIPFLHFPHSFNISQRSILL